MVLKRGSRSRSFFIVIVSAALLTAFSALGMLASGCGGGGDGETEQASAPVADVLTLACANEYAAGWDPRVSGGNEIVYMANMYETLLRVNPPGSTEPFEPVLATSWESSPDSTEWTFKLREGVTFHDGTPCNAEAVKYSIDATKELGEGVSYVLDPIESVEVVDDYTVKFVLNGPAPLDRVLSAEYAAFIFSPATEGKPSDWWIGKSYGTGPYKIESFKQGEEHVYARHPDYWDGWSDDEYKKVVVRIVAEAGTQRQMLEGGEVDFVYQVDRDAVSALESNPNVVVEEVPSLVQFNLVLNTLRAPLDNVKVRQALAWATPYEDIIEVGVNGFAAKSVGMVPKGLFPYEPSLPSYDYDPEKAKQLLAEAGYPDGEGMRKLVVVYWSDAPFQSKYAPLVKEAWEGIGVPVELQPMLSQQGYARATGPEDKRQDVVIDRQWPSIPHGYDMLWYQWHSQDLAYNWSYWSSAETDELMDEAWEVEPSDVAKAKELYDECQELLIENVPCIPMFDLVDIYASSATVKVEKGGLNTNYPLVLFWRMVNPAGGS